ncbi:MMS19 nucleotide excision repair protein homolog isoform X2 [Sesamum indicum]|uniref:MMS19 nucleotide excision repair protein n=1 Tax=Sesamum indicum TaxID=4182 RepID=A0A6I9SXQ1_SESIN|nr:MMS19 nucleotide excision repair protein homolog isoform X2 [Sesamum indicum]
MADSIQWIQHVELYVSSSATPSQQVASVDAVATLLKNDLLTLEALVREMEMYLTTTDSIIRCRGILLLGELLAQLTLKPLDSTSIHSLIGFFTERLADWKALRGAIVGCLALLRRKSDVGRVTDSEAKAVAQSYLQNLQVQSLGQHDRKLSFQLMECLLDRYAGAMADLGDNLVYGICEAIDGEKDPQCLLLVFHIVESLAQLSPGPLANFAEDLFEILGCYFPIHFTHPKGEDDDVKREELARALMLAFASTPLFEPFSIPLLLEKLSSSLPSAKVESFKYLSYCTAKYGPERMAKHAEALWASLKDTTYLSPQSMLSMEPESMSRMNFQESDVMTEAFVLLQEVIRQYGEFISLIIGDNDINAFLISLNQYKGFDDIPLQVKQKLHAVGHILSACAKASAAMCNKVFESFFPFLMDGLGLSVAQPSQNNSYLDEECFSLAKFKFGPLYLCIELIAACKSLTLSLYNCTSIHDFPHQRWCSLLSSFSESLVKAFVSMLRSNVADNEQSAYVYCGVKGLQILATFPGSFTPVSKSVNDNIFLELVSIITSDSNKTFEWTSALKALVEIGFSIDKCLDSEKAASFESTVVEKIVSLISSLDSAIPLSLRLQAAFEIGATRKDFMLRVVRGLDESIDTNFSAVFDHGNHKSDELTIKLLDTYSQKVLPWFLEIGGSEEVQLNFALRIWDKIENFRALNLSPPEFTSDLLGATMTAMKKAVASCSEESQEIIINKASGVLFSSTVFGSMGFKSGSSILKEEGLQQTQNYGNSSGRDEWLTSLFASVVVALRPQTGISNRKMILQLFITSLLNGHVPSAHALGSLVNKLPLETKGIKSSRSLSLNEALDMIFHSFVGTCRDDSTSGNDGSGVNINSLRLNTSRIQLEFNTVIGLAWIGKGLLMRGHEKVKDITMTLLSFLTLDCEAGVSKQFQNLAEVLDEEGVHQLMKCAGDAFHIIMSDSGECLNRMYHATVRPLYKQRFFSTIMPILLSLVVKSESSFVRSMLYRAFAHVVSDTPLTAILGEAKKLFPILLECLSTLSKDVSDKGIIYSVLLVISGILLDKNGQEAAVENASSIVNQLIELTAYPHMMAVRETAIQCLVAVSELPHARVYPLRTKVLRTISKALDDPKRIVRQEAVRCRQAWASIASRSIHF